MKVPCIECISFAICKQRVRSMERPDITSFSKICQCDLLKGYVDFLDREFSIPKFIPLINAVRELYGIELVKLGRKGFISDENEGFITFKEEDK